jgi:hypothetical protein
MPGQDLSCKSISQRIHLVPFCAAVFLLTLYDIFQSITQRLKQFVSRTGDSPPCARQGSQPEGLKSVGLVVTDPASSWLEPNVIEQIVLLLQKHGAERITVHDVFGNLHTSAVHLGRSPQAPVSISGTASRQTLIRRGTPKTQPSLCCSFARRLCHQMT